MDEKGKAGVFFLILIVIVAAGIYQFRDRKWVRDFLVSSRAGIEAFKDTWNERQGGEKVFALREVEAVPRETSLSREEVKSKIPEGKKPSLGEEKKVIPREKKAAPPKPDPEDKTAEGIAKYAHFLYSEGEYVRAIKEYSQLLKDHPRFSGAAGVQYAIGEGYRALRFFEDAIEAYQEVLKNYPASSSITKAQYNIGVIYHLDLENYEEARKEYEKVLLIGKNNPFVDDAQYMIAFTYQREGNFAEARREYQKVIDEYPRSKRVPTAHYDIGSCYRKEGESEKALQAYKLVVREYSGNIADKALQAINEIEKNR